MKSVILFALFIAAAVAAPLDSDKDATETFRSFDNIGVEGFQYASKTSNGISNEAEGKLVDVGTENEGLEVRGQYSYVGPDGVTYSISYTAGKAGFQPAGAHIPVA